MILIPFLNDKKSVTLAGAKCDITRAVDITFITRLTRP